MPISLFQPHLKALFLPLVLVDDHAHLQSEIIVAVQGSFDWTGLDWTVTIALFCYVDTRMTVGQGANCRVKILDV